jgi:hypothetical protein
MEGFFHSCKILLAHFHFVCKGALPIQSINWKDSKTVKFARLDKEQVEFMEQIQSMVRKEGMNILIVSSRYLQNN